MKETKFKDTEIGKIPEDWEVTPIGKACNVRRGVRVTKEQLTDEGRYPVYQNTNYPMGYFDNYNVDANTPFVIVGGSAGQIGLSKERYWAADDCAYFEKSNTLNKVFLYYELTHRQFEIKKFVRTASVPRLDRKVIESFVLPLPSLHEQHRIASALTSIDNLISSLDKLIEKKKNIKQGTMQQLLTGKTRLKGFSEPWVEKKLGDVAVNYTGLTYSPMNVKSYGTLVLRSSNIQKGILVFNDNVFVDMDIPSRAIAKKNDLLICVRNGSKALIGKSAVITDYADGMAFGAFMTILHANDIQQGFLNYLWQADYIQQQVKDNMGATINQITNADIEQFKIVVPHSLKEQQAIATILTKMDNEITALEAKKAKYEAIKQGMMQQLLTGKIRLIS